MYLHVCARACVRACVELHVLVLAGTTLGMYALTLNIARKEELRAALIEAHKSA